MAPKSAASRPVGVGVVGCGRIAALRHFPALAGVRDARVVAVADADPGRLESVAERFGVARRCLDPLELVADPVVDVVAVCVPAERHAGVAIASLEAGKHVLVEKPLCLALDDADRLAWAAEQSAGTVMVAFNLRWHRLARKAREVVRSGVLGKIDAVRTVWSSSFDHRSDVGTWRRERRSGGGVLLEIGPHHFDLVRFLLEDELVEVAAFSRSGPWEDEAAVVTARTAGGVLVSAVLSQRSVNDNELEIFGTAGRLRLSFYRHDGFEVVASPAFPAGLGNRLRRAVVGAGGDVAGGGDRSEPRRRLRRDVPHGMAPLPRRRSRRTAPGMHARGRKAKPRAPSRRYSLGRTTGCRQGRRCAAFDHRAQRRVTTMSEHGLPAMSIVIVTDAFDTIRKTVAHLRAQTVRDRLELVIVTQAGVELPLGGSELGGFHGVSVITVEDIQSLSWARARDPCRRRARGRPRRKPLLPRPRLGRGSARRAPRTVGGGRARPLQREPGDERELGQPAHGLRAVARPHRRG